MSLLQLGLEAVVLSDASLVTGNPVKLLLALVSIAYDTLLIGQHVAYAHPASGKTATSEDLEHETLIADQET